MGLHSSRGVNTMANIDIDKNENLGEEQLEQVKGGPAYMKLGDIKGEVEATGSAIKTGYDVIKNKKV